MIILLSIISPREMSFLQLLNPLSHPDAPSCSLTGDENLIAVINYQVIGYRDTGLQFL